MNVRRRNTIHSYFVLVIAAITLKPAFTLAGNPQTSPSESAPPFPAATPWAVVDCTHKVFPAVVRLDVSQSGYHDGKPSISRDIGSGVIFDEQGHILTNFHVAGRAVEIHVTLADKQRVAAQLVGVDHWTDLAVVQLDLDDVHAKHADFSFVPFGESASLIPGQDVMAVGTPFGLARTMTLGTISTVERTLYPQRLEIEGYETGDYSNWVQMDVPINPGNSGGPLVDLNGKVVGINTRGGQQNLNFAIPIDTAKPVVEAILRSFKPGHPGHFDRSDLGIDLKPMQDLEAFYKVDTNHGVFVDGVQAFSASERAGVKPQDLLTAIDGRPTNARFPEELAAVRQMIASLPIGKPCVLTLQRAGQPINVTVVTDMLQGAIGDEGEIQDWGLSVRDVTRAYAASTQLDSSLGALVTSVTPDLAAATAAVLTGDVIVAVDDTPITKLADLQRAASDAKAKGADKLMLTISRDRSRRSIIIKPTNTSATQP